MSDPLSQFCRAKTPQATASTMKSLQAGKRPYEAYDASGKPCPYTEIRCLLQPSQAPQSRFLMAVVFSADYEEAFSLIYSFVAVEVRGKNLKPVRKAVQNGRCEFIQEYHEDEFLPPAKQVPVIESIRFITGQKLDDILASHKAGR